VDLHPEDARTRNITAGQWLTLSSPRGVIRMKARISEAVHPGVVRIAWGWGEVDPQANVNNLTDDNRRDPVTGTPSNRSFMCRMESLGSAERGASLMVLYPKKPTTISLKSILGLIIMKKFRGEYG
jgi:predicted molibdopterin-dependent oxidoreductase YjgC